RLERISPPLRGGHVFNHVADAIHPLAGRARREWEEGPDELLDRVAGTREEEEPLQHPDVVVRALERGALERIPEQIDQPRRPQFLERLEPDVEAQSALLHQDELPAA